MEKLFKKAQKYTLPQDIKKMGLYPYFIPADGIIGPITHIHGEPKLMFGSNNYMGLTNHPEMVKAGCDALKKYGTGCTGSRFLNGTLELHLELEEKLAKFIGKESAITFSTGYQTNLGVLSGLTQKGDFIISDQQNHASIVDGCRLSYAETKVFKHNDMEDLERVLKSLPQNKGKLIVSDGVFSMEGSLALVPQLAELAEQYSARLMIDDAHGVGYLGDHGEGVGGHFKMIDRIDLLVGTFSKSFASIGGFCVSNDDVINYIQHHARSFIFSASLLPPAVAAIIKAIELIENGDDLRKNVMYNARLFESGLRKLGFETGESETPVVPVYIRDEIKVLKVWKALLEAGLYSNPVRAPAVAVGDELLRNSLMATHTEEQIQDALDIYEKVGQEFNII
ncbi:MAG: aminotransferase class I/II-fold pyridoxal phosphate-dependent enzyme [Promethearchaeota archaeon]